MSHGLISVTRAAELLAETGDPIERSSLSRYVAKHADALNPVRRGRDTLVDFEALALHRRENIRLGAPVDPKPFAGSKSRADEAARKLSVERQIRELDLVERQGILTPIREVQDAAYAAVSALKGQFALALNDTAEIIAAACGTESRLVRPHLRALERKALEAFARVLTDHSLLTPEQPDP